MTQLFRDPGKSFGVWPGKHGGQAFSEGLQPTAFGASDKVLTQRLEKEMLKVAQAEV